MKIELKEIPISEVIKNYINNNDENGVIGWDNKLNIRPKYQREFIYKDKQRNSVIETIKKNFPLNVMYWVRSDDNTYEVLDGQQRTISICEYTTGKFSLENLYFHNLKEEEQKQILDYKLMVYFCEGSKKEKLDWFKTINIAGEKLTNQELRNAIYTGSWLSDAKRYFSRSGCPAHDIASNYMKGSSIRQDYLETVINWASDGNIEDFMATHQHEINANKLWLYFQNVINWVKVTFPNYRKLMKGLPFGPLYDNFGDKNLDPIKLEKEITTLLLDDDVTKKSGVYSYVLTRNERELSIRNFSDKQKNETYEKQKGICIKCNNHFSLEEMEADHIKPWSKGGKTISENCQMLCKQDNRIKSNK